jgi:hypothetical protein
MANGDLFDDTFDRTVKAAVAQARKETLAAGVPLFYHDSVSDRDVMERPDGRIFEIRFIPGAPRESHYEVLRELGRNAA